MIQDRDIIMFGLQPWDIEIGSNFKNMAVEIAKHNRVLYINRPLDRFTAWKKKNDNKTKTRLNSIRKGEGFVTGAGTNLWVSNPAALIESINWMPPGIFYRLLNKRNNKILAREIRRAAGTLNFKDPLLIIDNDFFNGLYLKEYLQARCMVYYIRDYLLSQLYFNKHGRKAEPALIAKADVVTANSLYLCNYAKQYNNRSFYIGQGCDVEEFVQPPAEIPEDIRSIEKPIIGYCGMLTASRLNMALIENIALQRPSWNIVLVGPEDESFSNSKLHQLNNVHFLGIRPAAALPGYVHHFNICINPQLVNQMTIGNYPRKVDEYLAAGKPVVATQTEAMQEFKQYASLCNNAEEYIEAIETELADAHNESRASARQAYARSHTWQASVAQLYTAINSSKHG